MTDADFETIYAITLEDPENIGCMISSTPTGRRGMFYKICNFDDMKFNGDEEVRPINTTDGYHYDPRKYDKKKAAGWKEFYFPTMVNPGWSPKMEKELRKQYTEVAYEHEILADFGTETIGVYDKDLVDEAASQVYELQENGPIYPNGLTAIGVDWDKFGTASNIVVTEYDPADRQRARPEMGEEDPGFGRFRVINRIEVPKSEMHYDKAVQIIKNLDELYQPFAIYCDRGAGEIKINI